MFGERLKYVRTTKNKTQKQMALDLNISEPCYNNYEKGKRQPDFETLLNISYKLDVSIDYLLGNDKIIEKQPNLDIEINQIILKKRQNKEFSKLLTNISKLDNKQLQTINNLLDLLIKKEEK